MPDKNRESIVFSGNANINHQNTLLINICIAFWEYMVQGI